MIFFKKSVKNKMKSYIYYPNQLLREKLHKKWNQECKQKQSHFFNFCNIFDLLTSRTQKIAWWPLFLNLIFTYFSIMNNSGKFKEISSTSFYCIIPPLTNNHDQLSTHFLIDFLRPLIDSVNLNFDRTIYQIFGTKHDILWLPW